MASQITATLPALDFPLEADYPTQEDWAAFSAAAELNFGILGNGWSTQMQLWKDQANDMSTELNTNATIAQGLANYQGDWVSQGYTLGQTVSVSGIYYICKLTHPTGQNPTDMGSLYWSLVIGNWNLKVNTDMSGYSSKATPSDTDLLPLSDSTSSFSLKKLTWANLKATLKTYFDTLYLTLTGNQTVEGIKTFSSSPIVPTATAQDNSTKVATTAYVDGKMVLGTAINTTSGTAFDFTNIPSWVKRITVILSGISLSGSSLEIIQIGSGSIQTTGYNGASWTGSGSASLYTNGFKCVSNNQSTSITHIIMTLIRVQGNTWVASHSGGSEIIAVGGGSVTLSGVLDRVRITTANGTDTFDAGQINIMYEG